MKSTFIAVCLIATGFAGLAGLAVAQETPGFPKPLDEHKWLKKFVGQWDVVNKGIMAEGQPPVESKGTIKSKMMGDFFVVNQMDADFGGLLIKGVQTIGYDTTAKKYVGTWIDTTSHFMWKYQGAVDKTGKKLILEADGPDMTNPGKMLKYRDAYEFKSDDEIIVTSSMQNSDGKWVTFLNGTAKRVTKKKVKNKDQ